MIDRKWRVGPLLVVKQSDGIWVQARRWSVFVRWGFDLPAKDWM